MKKWASLYIKVLIYFGTTCLLALALPRVTSVNKGFKDTLLDYIKSNSRTEEINISLPRKTNIAPITRRDNSHLPFMYLKGDWGKYIISNKYTLISKSPFDEDISVEKKKNVFINSYGSMKLDLLYGKSEFTKDRYRRFDEDEPVSRIIDDGFNTNHELQLHMEGNVGKKLTVYVDHDSGKSDNHYLMQYKAVNEDEVIREINAGEIDIGLENSKYVAFDETTIKGVGIDLTLKKKNLKVKAFGSIIKGETEIEIFRGNSSPDFTKLSEYQYIRNTYYQLEPFKRYDGLESPPSPSPENYNNLITFTSNPPDPEKFMPHPVNIDPAKFELYMDDQDAHNNLNTLNLTIGTKRGNYHKLVSGVDYSINYSTGLITFLKGIPNNASIFAVYRLNGGSINSSDPAARTDVDIFNGRIFVFIKDNYSIHEDLNQSFDLNPGEDKNGDGILNLDIYEVRSFYQIGDRQILEDNFRIQFYKENVILRKNDIRRLGKLSVDYADGIINFSLREPFRQISGESRAGIIYSEHLSDNAYLSSIYKIRINYYREARSFQLKRLNIIPESVRIRVNHREAPDSLYVLDYTSGFLEFTDPNNPVIGPETEIEVKYEYLPFHSETKSFMGGLRTDYMINRSLGIGGTLLYTRDSESKVIPNIGNEPEQTLVLEGDTSLHLGEKRLKKLIKNTTGMKIKSVPVEIDGYAEYARSYKKINTFGKALIDNMEENEEIISISLSEKDWVLSSMPLSVDQGSRTDRGLLHYFYYRDPYHPDTLKGLEFSPYIIPYSIKPGPYNIATGHLPDAIQSYRTQRSLVLNFDFSTGNYVPIVTRRLSSKAVDFSGLQYIELWYKSAGGNGQVELYLDIGVINEDSDGDGRLDTEDSNNNGFLDFGANEDSGYKFDFNANTSTQVGTGPKLNSFTMGDGVLNSEDLNDNGVLDASENIFQIPGERTFPNNTINPLIVDLNDMSWKKARIYIDAALSENPLKKVEAVRLYLKKSEGAGASANTGIVYIDSIKFISSQWRNVKVDGESSLPSSPDEFRVAKVDTINDDEYRRESYMFQMKDKYKSLYGGKSDSELLTETETALQIEYNLSTGENGSVTKKFSRPMDLRFYKTLNIWFNYREFAPGDSIGIKIGSSENDYIEYKFPMDYSGVWRELKLKLNNGSTGDITGIPNREPDLKRISYVEITVYGDNGKFWVNDIYVSEPEALKDSAYWYEGKIKFKRPLYITNSGIPVLSDLNIKYIQKGHGSHFSTIGKTDDDVMEEYKEVFSSVKILPNWSSQFGLIVENSETDSFNEEVYEEKKGKTEKNTFTFESDYISKIYAFPSIKLIYKQDNYNNRKDARLSDYKIYNYDESRIYTPTIILRDGIDNILGGSLFTKVIMDMLFKEDKIKRNSNEINQIELEQFISSEEKESRQKGKARISVDYRNRRFFIHPAIDVGSHEIVKLQGRADLNDTEVLNDVNGDFHFPFLYNKDYKFVERNKKTALSFGLKEFSVLSPEMSLEFYYKENKFRDYDISERIGSAIFSRAKNAGSFISSRIDLPFDLRKFKYFSFFSSLNISYTRSIYFQEIDIPYEGEGISSFDEKYGIKKVYNGFANSCLNLFMFPPWHFFKGRNNFANGRDYNHEKFNMGIYFPDNSPVINYNNSLQLIDNLGASSTFNFEKIALNFGGGINQISERQIIYGIPQQVVTLNFNLNIIFDLMRIFHFGFFRPNKIGLSYHSANINIGYDFNRNMIITSNIEENSHSPNTGITFKWDRTSLSLKIGMDYRQRNKREYISMVDSKRSWKDDIYITNMQTFNSFRQRDRGYSFSSLYETDVQWIYNLFSGLYKLVSYPIFSLEYSLLIDRYDYSDTVSPEPYDQHLITERLTIDLHKNIQGGISTRLVLERFKDRETNELVREVRSYEIGFNFSLLF